MIKPIRTFVMILVLACPPGAVMAEVEAELSVEDLLARIDRNSRMTADSARMMIEGLEGQSQPAMVLELVLLEAYGPEPVRAPVRARERLQHLLADGGIPGQGPFRALLEILERDLALRGELAGVCRELRDERDRERHAHAETRAKLEALRAIDEDMDNGGEDPDGGAGSRAYD